MTLTSIKKKCGRKSHSSGYKVWRNAKKEMCIILTGLDWKMKPLWTEQRESQKKKHKAKGRIQGRGIVALQRLVVAYDSWDVFPRDTWTELRQPARPRPPLHTIRPLHREQRGPARRQGCGEAGKEPLMSMQKTTQVYSGKYSVYALNAT